jgi:hypothetical protein
MTKLNIVLQVIGTVKKKMRLHIFEQFFLLHYKDTVLIDMKSLHHLFPQSMHREHAAYNFMSVPATAVFFIL